MIYITMMMVNSTDGDDENDDLSRTRYHKSSIFNQWWPFWLFNSTVFF